MMFIKKHFGPKEEKDLSKDILDSINQLLSLKKGFGGFQKDLGLSDIFEIADRNEAMDQLVEDLKRIIEENEPRIKLGEIEVSKNKFADKVGVTLNCSIEDSKSRLKVIVDPYEKKIKVQEI